MVTLTGEVIDTSGAMSGGGRERASGKMGTQNTNPEVDGQDIRSLERELREAEAESQDASQERRDREDRLIVLRREYNALEKEKHKLTLEVKTLKGKEATFREQIAHQEEVLAGIKPDEAKLAELAEKEAEKQATADESRAKVEEVEVKVKQLNRQIKEIMGSKLKSITKKRDEAKSQLDKVKQEMTRLEVEIKSSERDIKKSKDRFEGYDAEIAEAETKMRAMKAEREELEKAGLEAIETLKKLKEEKEGQAEAVTEMGQALEKLKQAENKFKSTQIEINQEREKFDTELKEQNKNQAHWKREVRKLRLKEIPGEGEVEELKTYDPEELRDIDMKQWQYDLNLLEERLSSQKANYAIIEEYNRKQAVYLERVEELQQITDRRNKQRGYHEDLRKMRLNEFMEGFSIITAKLKEMYQMITLGGDAELELVDSLDPFTEGIVFSVRPPKKSWKNISNLSGGEKTLSSLALVFALHYYKPTPLYVMDEIDAALDFKNVSIVANYIRERTKNAQFIIISLRSNMFELADRLVGIYKTYNCTKSVTINPGLLAAKETAA